MQSEGAQQGAPVDPYFTAEEEAAAEEEELQRETGLMMEREKRSSEVLVCTPLLLSSTRLGEWR